ncbi:MULTISPECIES: LytR C-terminal domain-containing protein [unclassified Kitasatospora]|uniref:LytR C-terminal domain-containing protein n=1 Tax=unclassified Kitasatospora TaxID=2633591 RepID=UPI0024747CA0|nr:LytR C-terminal domain-containing protein [Kitasatospora sp. MAP12-44]
MLTPQGLKGKQFRITGTSYPRLGPPPRRGRRILMLVGSLLALSLIALGGVQLVDIFTGKAKHGTAQACASHQPSGKPLAAPVAVSGSPAVSGSSAASASSSTASSASTSAAPVAGASPAAAAPSLPVAAASAIPQPQTVTVNVYNATDKAGLAARTADELKKRGFTVGKVGNAPSALDKKVPGTAELVAGQAGIGAATLLGSQVTGAATMADERTDASVDFVIGDGYSALLDPNAAAAALAAALKPTPSASPLPGSC